MSRMTNELPQARIFHTACISYPHSIDRSHRREYFTQHVFPNHIRLANPTFRLFLLFSMLMDMILSYPLTSKTIKYRPLNKKQAAAGRNILHRV